MDIVKLLIVILKLIAKLRECVSYFRSSGGQTVACSDVTSRDGTTNNQMGIELQNTDENSIIASVEASTSAGNGVHAKGTLFTILLQNSTLLFLFLSFDTLEYQASFGVCIFMVCVVVVMLIKI